MVDAVNERFHPLDRGRALLSPAHQDNALDDDVVLVLARDPEPRFVADDHRRHVAH